MIKLGQRILMLARGKSFLFLSKYNPKTALRHFIPTKPQNDILWICGGFCLVGIELDDGTGDETYLTILGETLPKIIHKFDPDMLFYQAGVDVLARRINWANYRLAWQAVISEINWYSPPLTATAYLSLSSWAGGYSDDVDTVVEAHCGVLGVVLANLTLI